MQGPRLLAGAGVPAARFPHAEQICAAEEKVERREGAERGDRPQLCPARQVLGFIPLPPEPAPSPAPLCPGTRPGLRLNPAPVPGRVLGQPPGNSGHQIPGWDRTLGTGCLGQDARDGVLGMGRSGQDPWDGALGTPHSGSRFWPRVQPERGVLGAGLCSPQRGFLGLPLAPSSRRSSPPNPLGSGREKGIWGSRHVPPRTPRQFRLDWKSRDGHDGLLLPTRHPDLGLNPCFWGLPAVGTNRPHRSAGVRASGLSPPSPQRATPPHPIPSPAPSLPAGWRRRPCAALGAALPSTRPSSSSLGR